MWGLESFWLQDDQQWGPGETGSGLGSQLWAPASTLLYALAFGQPAPTGSMIGRAHSELRS